MGTHSTAKGGIYGGEFRPPPYELGTRLSRNVYSSHFTSISLMLSAVPAQTGATHTGQSLDQYKRSDHDVLF